MNTGARFEILAAFLLSGLIGFTGVSLYSGRDHPAAASSRPHPGKPLAQKPAGPADGAAFRETREFLKNLEAAKLADLPALWNSLAAKAADEDSQVLTGPRMMVMERWAELDPAGALEFAKKQKDGLPEWVGVIFSVWGAAEPETALAAVKEEKGKTQSAAALGWLQSFSDDPAALVTRAGQLTWLDASKLEKETFRQQVPEDFLAKLYDADAPGMKKLAAWLPPWFADLLEELEWGKSLRENPEQALSDLETMPLNKDQLVDRLSGLESLSKSQPERVADLLMKLAERPGEPLFTSMSWNGSARKILENLIATMGPVAPERLGKVLSKLRAEFPAPEILTDTLLKTDPAAALKILPAFPRSDIIAESLLQPIPPMDSGEALNVVREAPPSYYRDKIMERALLELNGKDPAAAKSWIDSLPPGEVRNSAQLTLDLATATPEVRMMERVGRAELTGPLDKDGTARVQNATSLAAIGDPPDAAQRVSNWPAGPAQDAALRVLASRFASRDDPQKALEWVSSLNEESQRVAAYAGVAAGWTGADPVAASEWMSALPAGADRESAVGAFAGAIASRDPEAGLQWAATLANPGDRLQRLQEVTDIWKAKDSAAAAEGIRNLSGLSDADRAALLQTIK